MSVYRIFPEKDATIYSEFPLLNAGLTEVLDLSKYISLNHPTYSAVGRPIIKFDDDDISNIIDNYVQSSSFSSFFGMYLANASDIPLEYSLELYAVSESWDMGTGRYDESPNSQDGVCWKYKDGNFTEWNSISVGNVTGSSFMDDPGGGNWYSNTLVTQSFDNRTNKDVHMDVSSIVNKYVSGSLANEGFIIKNQTSIEFNKNYSYTLIYFSVDTNTIYPPYLDIKWDDSIYAPNTGSMSMIQSSTAVVSVGTNKGEFDQDSIHRFNINAREQFPRRSFVTSSVYTVGQYLPSSSYWRLRDYDTDNIIFDFDETYTKISTDQNGSFFTIFMNGLQPERYYKLQIRIDINGDSLILDNDYYFKIKR